MKDAFGNDLFVDDQVLYCDCGRNGDFSLAEVEALVPSPHGNHYGDKVTIRMGKTTKYSAYSRKTLTISYDRLVKVACIHKMFGSNPRDDDGKLVSVT